MIWSRAEGVMIAPTVVQGSTEREVLEKYVEVHLFDPCIIVGRKESEFPPM